MILINLVPVNFYDEAEFIFGAIKLTTVIGLILMMLAIDLGGAPNGDRIGFRYSVDPGPMNAYLRPGALGRFLAFWKVFIQATFSYGGSELCVVAAGETEPSTQYPEGGEAGVLANLHLLRACDTARGHVRLLRRTTASKFWTRSRTARQARQLPRSSSRSSTVRRSSSVLQIC